MAFAIATLPFSALRRSFSLGSLAFAIFSSSCLSTALSIRLTKKLATLATREGSPPPATSFSRPVEIGFRHLAIDLLREQQRDVDADAFADQMFDRGQAFRRRRHLHHQILALDVLPQPLGLDDGAFGVHRQIGRDFEADETVFALQPVVDRPQHVSGVLDVFDGDMFEQVGDRAVALFQRLADRAVIFVGTADGFFEDRGVRRHAFDAVGVDQILQIALGDEAAGEEIQPDGLTVVFECFDGIHDACSVRSSVFGFPGSFRVRGGNVNTWMAVRNGCRSEWVYPVG